MNQSQESAPLSAAAARTVPIDIIPGVRRRLLMELERINVPPALRAHYLSEMTGRAVQSASRWIAHDKPGLPDLRSLAILCLQFKLDANWMLGLTQHRSRLPLMDLNAQLLPFFDLPADEFDWIGTLRDQVHVFASACGVTRMSGNDMAPLIEDGAPVFFDPSHNEVTSNGIYLLEYDGKLLVRHVEIRMGEGILLRCENPIYNSTLIENQDVASRIRLKVIGRVRLAIALRHF